MSKSNAAETAILQLIFNGDTFANIADDTVTAPATSLSVALHTADPGEGGTQLTNEVAYTSYTRVNVARTTGGWTVAADTVNPASTISFPTGTGGSGTATHWSVGTGVGNVILYSGTISPTIVLGDGITPQLTTATSITEG